MNSGPVPEDGKCPTCGRTLYYEEGSAGESYAYCLSGDWVEQ